MRYALTDREWSIVQPVLPLKLRGVPRVADRLVLNGIFWIARTRAPWRDLPDRYGPDTTSFRQTASRRIAGRTRTDGSSPLSHGRSAATGPVGSHISSRPKSSSRSHTSEACQLA